MAGILRTETEEIASGKNEAPNLSYNLILDGVNYGVPVTSLTQNTRIRLNQQEKEATLFSMWHIIVVNAAEIIRKKIAWRMIAVRYIIETNVLDPSVKQNKKTQLETVYKTSNKQIRGLLDATSLQNGALVAGKYGTVSDFLEKIQSEYGLAIERWIQLGETTLANLSKVRAFFVCDVYIILMVVSVMLIILTFT